MNVNIIAFCCVMSLWGGIQGAPCNCGLGSGVDVCSDACAGNPNYPLVVRPQELPVIDLGCVSKPRIVCKQVGGDVSPLRPVGGLCSCGQTIVKPAVVPRPACACCNPPGSSCACASCVSSGGCRACGASSSSASSSSSSSQSSQSSSNEHIIGQSGGGSITIQFPQCGPPVFSKGPQLPQAPADAVSQDLAYRQQNQQKNDKAELKIAYGFQRIPADTPCAKKCSTFSEGNIQLINGQILELPTYVAPEEEEEEEYIEEEEPEAVEVLTPTFGDLGYRLANYKSGQFINVVNQEQSACNSGDEAAPPCNDGFRPGQVIIREGLVNSQIPPQAPPALACDEGEPPCESSNVQYYGVPSYSSYSASSSSSSSSSNSAQSQVYAQNLGCS